MKITFLKTGFSAQNLIYRHLTVKHLFVCTKHLIQFKDALMYFLLHFVFFMFLNSMVNLDVKHRCRWGILRFGGCRLFKLCNNGSWKVSWEDVCLFFSCSRLHFWFFLCLWFRIRSQTCVVLQAENHQLGFSVWTQLLLIWIVLRGRYLQRGWMPSPSRQRCLYQTQEVSSVSR